jgi:hypothetical protein
MLGKALAVLPPAWDGGFQDARHPSSSGRKRWFEFQNEMLMAVKEALISKP